MNQLLAAKKRPLGTHQDLQVGCLLERRKPLLNLHPNVDHSMTPPLNNVLLGLPRLRGKPNLSRGAWTESATPEEVHVLQVGTTTTLLTHHEVLSMMVGMGSRTRRERREIRLLVLHLNPLHLSRGRSPNPPDYPLRETLIIHPFRA